jgi:hypothetical protein
MRCSAEISAGNGCCLLRGKTRINSDGGFALGESRIAASRKRDARISEDVRDICGFSSSGGGVGRESARRRIEFTDLYRLESFNDCIRGGGLSGLVGIRLREKLISSERAESGAESWRGRGVGRGLFLRREGEFLSMGRSGL